MPTPTNTPPSPAPTAAERPGDTLSPMLDRYYTDMDGNEALEAYHARHGTQSARILTVVDDERAGLIVDFLRERIEGKVVVEIGGGIGLLACHMATCAKQVICFETDPGWMSCFVHVLYRRKPPNLTYIFGRAEELSFIRADVAIFVTCSGHNAMRAVASKFAPVVIDVHAELLGGTGHDVFSALAAAKEQPR